MAELPHGTPDPRRVPQWAPTTPGPAGGAAPPPRGGAAGRPKSSTGRTVGVTCLTLVLAAALGLLTFGGLLYWHFTSPEYQRRIFDQWGGHDLADDACERLAAALPAGLRAGPISPEWTDDENAPLTCHFTIPDASGAGTEWSVEVTYSVRHQPLLFGVDRSTILDGRYGGDSESEELLADWQEVSDWRGVDGVGERAKHFLLWDDGSDSATGEWRQESGVLSSVARTQDDNAVIDVSVFANLPLAEDDDFGDPDTSAIAANFGAPAEAILPHTLVALD
ncbi:hypothetical protein J4H86_09155 [Spiractinospora alimapuensis]|uniref:hypothetical protein n=1 Tax=Spiractinospora alimapuensis TaxID=2820884 RepID=UPI001F197E90|nr:hypothetical protein [Spiractinospora alimapuensis]QVQ53857.1 hypothetical protein J4H86_09155 [Spiractinospora alimapuensis]